MMYRGGGGRGRQLGPGALHLEGKLLAMVVRIQQFRYQTERRTQRLEDNTHQSREVSGCLSTAAEVVPDRGSREVIVSVCLRCK